MWFRKKKPEGRKTGPLGEIPPLPAVDTLTTLITALADASAKRYVAQLEHDAKVDEYALKRHALDLENAEAIAKGAAIEREAKEKLRQLKREWSAGNPNGTKGRPKGSQQQECKVCADKGDPTMSAQDISWHYAGHPGQQSLGLKNGS
jgi:hypothetical protein